MFYFTVATLFAQAAVTLRIYAITGNNRWFTYCLSFVTTVQFIFGVCLSTILALRSPVELPDLPFDEYQFCIFQPWLTGEIVYTTLSVVYDVLAFLVVVYSARNRGPAHALGAPSLFGKIVQGATMYFLVIFTGHIMSFLEFFAPPSVQIIPASGNVVLIPMMITRLMLSLKRNPNPADETWSLGESTQQDSVGFSNRTIGGTERWGGNIALRNL